MSKQPDTYALFYLNTGGGHRAPARALTEFYAAHHVDAVKAVMVDGLDGSPRYARRILEDGYRILQARARWLYELLYVFNKIPLLARGLAAFVSKVLSPGVRKVLETIRPQKVIVLHFFLIKPVVDSLRALGWKIPVVVIVTDPFTAHPLWFLDSNVRFIVYSEVLREHCIQRGIPAERVSVFPVMLGARFSSLPKTDGVAGIKKSTGIDPRLPVVLLVGGGDGLPRGKRILRALAGGELNLQIVIVCGKNRKLESAARAMAASSPVRVHVFGYTDKIFELIASSDLVISKAGASTMMEVLLMGKIPVVTDYLWEQEKGNVDFLMRERIGVYEPSVDNLPVIVRTILESPTLTAEAARRREALQLRNGTPEIAKYLIELQ